MADLKSYVLTVVVAAILGAVIMSIAPTGKGQQKMLKVICGFFLLLVVCAPLKTAELNLEEDLLTEARKAAQAMEAEAKEQVDEEMSERIRQKVGAYIEDKAAELGAVITAKVSLQQDFTPWSVELSGSVAPYTKAALSRTIAEELSIPQERQVWLS